jgi:putative heme-binding domain-containing protein
MRGVATIVLAAGFAIGPMLLAQTAPATLPPGDAIRGKAIVEGTKGNCLSCHRVGTTGALYGPNLTTIGLPQRAGGGRGGGVTATGSPAAPPAQGRAAAAANPAASPANLTPQQLLMQSLVDPSAVVSVQNRYVRLTMRDGKVVWGKLLNLDTFYVQIFDSTEKLANVSRADVREMTVASPMPSYRDKLTAQELADVVEYLMTLKGP